MVPRVLIVEPKVSRGLQLARTIDGIAEVDAVTDFASARAVLLTHPPDYLVVNLRLGPYNGLHLVYTAAASDLQVRSIVYTDQPEPGLGTEIQSAGAFYETLEHLFSVLPTYLASALPARDRRDVWRAVLDSAFAQGRGSTAHLASWYAH